MLCPSAAALTLAIVLASTLPANAADPRPSRWCGWWLRQQLSIPDKSLNLARMWAVKRQRVSGPCVGCIAVWPHHVGLVTGHGSKPGTAVIKSGNDGGRVRERERSIRNVIAWVR
jgi:hypothetical protein